MVSFFFKFSPKCEKFLRQGFPKLAYEKLMVCCIKNFGEYIATLNTKLKFGHIHKILEIFPKSGSIFQLWMS